MAENATTIKIEGPIEGGKHGWIFCANLGNLATIDYEENEYFISGTATRFTPETELKPDGKWEIRPCSRTELRTELLEDPLRSTIED